MYAEYLTYYSIHEIKLNSVDDFRISANIDARHIRSPAET